MLTICGPLFLDENKDDIRDVMWKPISAYWSCNLILPMLGSFQAVSKARVVLWRKADYTERFALEAWPRLGFTEFFGFSVPLLVTPALYQNGTQFVFFLLSSELTYCTVTRWYDVLK